MAGITRWMIFLLVPAIPGRLYAQYIRAPDLPAFYDVRSGNLTVDLTNVTGGESIGYVLDPLGLAGFRTENFTPFMTSPLVTATEELIGEHNFAGVAGGVYDLGDILPVGLSQLELIDTYFGTHRGEPGTPNSPATAYYVLGPLGSRTFHLLQPIYSPSPYPAINVEGVLEVDRWAQEVSLVYDSGSGHLTLDTQGANGGAIWSYQILLNDTAFRVEDFDPITEELSSVVDASSITETAFGAILEGVYDLGPVLPIGMSGAQFSSTIRRASFVGEPGHDVLGLSLGTSGIEMSLQVIVPEPSGVGLLSLGLVAILALRDNNRR